uniref:Uncharacterized protein n=1 Tax=Callithrix jacchus TaxID=9483 RepID=F7EUL8_CALJA
MSSPDEVPVWGTHLDLEGGEQAGALTVSPRAPRGHGHGLYFRVLHSCKGEGEGEGGFADPGGISVESDSELIEEGRVVLWGREAPPGNPVDDQRDGVEYSSCLAKEPAAIVPPTSVQGHPSPEGAAAKGSADNWAGPEVRPSERGLLGPRPGKRHHASARPLHLTGPRAGPAWQHLQRGSKSTWRVRVDLQQPSAKGPAVLSVEDSDSTDESCDLRPMRVGIHRNGGSQAKPQSPKKTAGARRHRRQSFSLVPGPFLTSAPRGLTPLVERPAVGELENSPWKKIHSRARGNVEVRPSYSGAATAGALPRGPRRRKTAQEKKSQGDASQLALGRALPICLERLSATPQEPATFPPFLGVRRRGCPRNPKSLSTAALPGGEPQEVGPGSPRLRPERIMTHIERTSQGPNLPHRGQGCLALACIVENSAVATPTSNLRKFQELQSPRPTAWEASCPDAVPTPVITSHRFDGVEGRGVGEGGKPLALSLLGAQPCSQASLPTQAAVPWKTGCRWGRL